MYHTTYTTCIHDLPHLHASNSHNYNVSFRSSALRYISFITILSRSYVEEPIAYTPKTSHG